MSSLVGAGEKIPQLTGLRYFAALLVFVHHVSWEGSHPWMVNMASQGYVGVSFFFVLSGFVLSHSYSGKIRSGSLTFGKFALLRLARLSPLHFATALPFVLYGISKGNLDVLKTTLNLLYLQSWIPDARYYFTLNMPSWSLSDEMFFYLCFFPLVLLSIRSRILIGLGLAALVVASAIFVWLRWDEQVLLGPMSLSHWLFYIFPGFRLLEFIVGMILFEVWTRRGAISAFWIVPSYLLLFGAMYFANDVPEAFRWSLLYLPVISLLLFAHLGEGARVRAVFGSRLLVLLGNASFALYLIHQPLIKKLTRLAEPLDLTNGAFFLMALVVISALSVLTYLVYERPAEGWLKSRVRRTFDAPRAAVKVDAQTAA